MIGKLFKLDEDERRIAVAVGLGAGIGSIFKIPLGGAVFSAEYSTEEISKLGL